MTSEAASGEEEASRVDASGHHHDKGKGKETTSTPGAHTHLFLAVLALGTDAGVDTGSRAFWTAGISLGRRSRSELVPASRTRTATATATAIAIAIATGAAAATARAEQRDGRRWFVRSGAAAAGRQGSCGAREHQGGGTVAADGGEG